MIKKLFYKIPPPLPLPKGEELPLFALRVGDPMGRRPKRGDICPFNYELIDKWIKEWK
jgi:hypothetical protein